MVYIIVGAIVVGVVLYLLNNNKSVPNTRKSNTKPTFYSFFNEEFSDEDEFLPLKDDKKDDKEG